MKFLLSLLIPIFILCEEFTLAKEDLHQIGLKVWQNECRGTVEGLIHWNEGEEFPSLGIGHFIWYPKEEMEKKFEETFPAFIDFLSQKLKETDPKTSSQKIPLWITAKKGFPWKTRESFLKDKRNQKLQQLRDLLSTTIDYQISYLFKRYELAEKKILPELSEKQKSHLTALKTSTQGIYALIDYVNFKGIGTTTSERYRGEGWGLLQVLQNMPEEIPENHLLESFIQSAKKTLAKRVHNAPTDRKEEKWMQGWYKRLETYRK